MKRTLKPVSFNLEDPFESKMIEFLTSQGAFSKYVKRLIQRDMDGISAPLNNPIQEPITKHYEPSGIADSFI